MDGIIIVNKSLGYTSRDVVNEVGKILNTRKIGHTGTLDPMASGVLVLCVGKALKVCEMLTNHDKEYIAGITLGIETDTLDMDGKILSTEAVDIDKSKIIMTINSFKKTYIQEVPKYSAVKVNGRKLYEYARNGIDVELPKKEVTIKEIELLDEITYENGLIYFKIKCVVSKGTYIRSLVRDIGMELGCKAVMNSLIRTRVGDFKLEDSYSIDDIKSNNYRMLNIVDIFSNITRIHVSGSLEFKIRNGCILDEFFDDKMAFIIDENNNLLALYENKDGKSKPFKMFV